MVMENDSIIRFDWAAKRMLRDKANFSVLEGLVTVLLGEKITISEIQESESNQTNANDKFNRVDIKAINSKNEIIIVEIQLTREWYYLQRILYGVSKTITEHISLGSKYENVRKVYSINILYFDLGKGNDYLYHGTTSFVGVHTGDKLKVRQKDADAIRTCFPEEIFPEYYLIRVNEFNDVARTPIEEWLDFLKNNRIKEDTTTPGLQEAREQLRVMKMSKKDRQEYDNYMDAIRTQNSVLDTYRSEGLIEGRIIGRQEGREEGRKEGREEGRKEGREEGREEGRKEGREEGREEGKKEEKKQIALNLLKISMPDQSIAEITGLSLEDIIQLKNHNKQ